MVVNNNAAAVLLVLAALAAGREVLVSRRRERRDRRRLPGARGDGAVGRACCVDVGTTNRTRLDDYRPRPSAPAYGADAQGPPLELPGRGLRRGHVGRRAGHLCRVPVVADIGSGLVDAACPWLAGGPPAWLAGEPAARQTLAAGRRARHLQLRQAARRPAGRGHRRATPTSWRAALAIRWPRAAARRPRARCPAGRRARLPPARRHGDGAVLADGRRSRSLICEAPGRCRSSPRPGSARSRTDDRVPGAGSLPGVGLPSAGVVAARRPSGRAQVGAPADHRPRPRAADVPRPADRRSGRRRPAGRRARAPFDRAPHRIDR